MGELFCFQIIKFIQKFQHIAISAAKAKASRFGKLCERMAKSTIVIIEPELLVRMYDPYLLFHLTR